MSLPKSRSKDKIGRVTKAAVKSKFKPVSAAAKTDKAEKEKDKDNIPVENPMSPNGHGPTVGASLVPNDPLNSRVK
jgi:hypothetical protein